MQIAKGVSKACCLQLAELTALLVGKAGISAVRLGVLEVDFLRRHIQIAADHDRLMRIQLLQMLAEHILPHHAVIKAQQSILRVRRVHSHQIKIVKLQRNHASLGIMLCLPQTIMHSQRLHLRENRRTAIALALSAVPVFLIAGELKARLLALHLRFLQADNIRRRLCQKIGKALRHAGTQSVNVPRKKFHNLYLALS